MANNPSDTPADDFLQQILGFSDITMLGGTPSPSPIMLHLNSADHNLAATAVAFDAAPLYQLGLSLEQGKEGGGGYLKNEEEGSDRGNRFRNHVSVSDGRPKNNVFHGQPMPSNIPAAPHAPAIRPRVRARRGQATDPHSIAERLRREKIAERIRALQELVPSVNKTDRAAMLDEIVDYVKFLRLQVKVLSMSRLGGAGAVAPLVTDIPLSSVEEEGDEGERNRPAWDKWSNDGTERQVAKLMEENVGAAMQFLQMKALCIMPISLASAIYQSQPPDTSSSIVKTETNPPS
ncbi:hypothetical protein RIF29_40258 [Crotalaria pallida]|uniref:BHLH domain-containing protein n=1 Tax=Crotalaria pallida TaxID=3830 RepID=A0AAN9E2U7_CROPI